METEEYKAEEAIKWMGLFEVMLSQAYLTSLNQKDLYLHLKRQITTIKNQCEYIIENK